MISEANQKAIEAAGLSFILGMKIPDVPYLVDAVAARAPGRGHPRRARLHPALARRAVVKRRDQLIYYQYRADRARRTLRGIDEQVAKAAKAVAGLAPVKRNRFIALDGAVKSVNRELEAKARTLAGIKGYVTNLAACPDGTPVTADFVIGSYHQLWNIEKSFRMSKSDLQARPDLPPQARLHRGPPDHRLRRPRRQPVDRSTDRLVDQEIRQDRPPLPHHRDPGRTADHHRRRPLPDDLRQALRRHQPRQRRYALIWPKSGLDEGQGTPSSATNSPPTIMPASPQPTASGTSKTSVQPTALGSIGAASTQPSGLRKATGSGSGTPS